MTGTVLIFPEGFVRKTRLEGMTPSERGTSLAPKLSVRQRQPKAAVGTFNLVMRMKRQGDHMAPVQTRGPKHPVEPVHVEGSTKRIHFESRVPPPRDDKNPLGVFAQQDVFAEFCRLICVINRPTHSDFLSGMDVRPALPEVAPACRRGQIPSETKH